MTTTITIDPEVAAERLRKEMNRHVRGRGVCTKAEVYEEAKGGGWVAFFDSEYAALRAFWVYRNSPNVRLGISTLTNRWFVSNRPHTGA